MRDLPMMTRILIVDDDEDNRDLFCEAVRQLDSSIECTRAKDGEEALEILKSGKVYKPDFIFLDLNMPRVNGGQFLIEFNKSKEFRHIPVIIYTTSKRKEDQEDTKKLGAVHFITKPNKLSDLYKAISFVLERNWESGIKIRRK